MFAPPRIDTACFPDPRHATLRGAIFVPDLEAACTSVFEIFGARATAASAGPLSLQAITLPITVPVDSDGVIVLSTGHVDAPRHPATLTVVRPLGPATRRGYRAAFLLARKEDQPLRLPGVLDASPAATGPRPAALSTLSVAVAPKGLAVVGFGLDRATTPLHLDETTARLLATALLITVGVKLAKAERGES